MGLDKLWWAWSCVGKWSPSLYHLWKMFDEYSASRPSVRREAQGGHNLAWTNVLSHYVAVLLSMLKQQVLHHSITKATATLEAVAMAMDQVPDVLCRAGGCVLSQSADSYRQTLQLLKLMYTWRPTERVGLLLETAVYMASHGDLQEAYYTLQSQIHTEPFKSDVLIHGYSGVMQYLMWKEAWLERGGVVKEGGVEDERLRGFSEQALKHFVAVGELDGQPCHDIDIFISIHSQLLTELDRNEEALQLLISYSDKCPTRIPPHRLVCDHVKQYCCSEGLSSHLNKLVELDESSLEAIELAEILLERATKVTDYKQILELLVKYLDYPHNRDNQHAWCLLNILQKKWTGYKRINLWTERMKWWPVRQSL